MAITLQHYAVVIGILVGVLAILACLAIVMRVHRLWARRRFYVKDFEILSDEASVFCAETAHVNRAVRQDEFLEASIKAACLGIINVAEGYDIGIRIELAAWEDMLHPSLRDSDAEVGKCSKEEETEARRKLERKHRRYVIGVMRKRCMEGVQRRKRLSLQMQWMLTDVVSKDIDRLSAATSGALSGNPINVEHQKSIYSINSFSAFYIPDFEFGDEKPGSQSQRAVSAQPHSTQERSIAASFLKTDAD